MTAAPSDEGGGAGGGQTGFRASLQVGLPDLVQLECLANTRGSFRVTSGKKIGYLVFDGGQLIHAITSDLTGEGAAFEILNWSEGTFEPCNVGWPETPTIHSKWESLLLLAAQARDESGRRRVVSLPTRASAKRSVPPVAPAPAATSEPTSMSAIPEPPGAVQAFIRMDPAGKVLATRGDVEELEAVASYTVRLAEIVGDALGLERFVALEASENTRRWFIHRDKAGNLLALRAVADGDFGALRQRIGL
jgi:hypothetical protein